MIYNYVNFINIFYDIKESLTGNNIISKKKKNKIK